MSAIAAALADAAHNRASAAVLGSLPSGWRNLASGFQVKTYRDAAGGEHRVEYRFTRTGLLFAEGEPVQLVSATPDEVVLADGAGVACGFAVARYGDDVYVDSARGPVHLVALPRFPEPGSAVEQGSLVAPMPGNVIRLGAAVGETVDAGQPLIWLEAMKMEHTITAPADGVLVELNVKTGQQVEVGTVLARVEAPQAKGDSEMTDTSFIESEERQALRKSVAAWAANYGSEYYLKKARAHEHTDELWSEAGKLGFLGVNLPEEYGGGGAGMYELSLVMEEMAAAGSALLLMVVSPAINGTIISKFGTEEQKKRWIPGIADGTLTMAFAITEPDAGSNSHKITTTARRDGSDWILKGQKVYISGIDQAQAVLVVGRTEEAKTGKLRPALFVVPTDAPGFTYTPIEMELISPERQFQVFLDDVRLPADALVGSEDAAIAQLFAGLNPERIMGAASSVGMGRFALDKAADYVKTRQVWGTPIGAHQGLSHPLAQCHIEVELAKLMMQKAAALYDSGDDAGAAEAANMAKYAAAEAATRSVDQAVQSMGGNGLTKEYGVAAMLASARLGRIAPVSREMVLNFVAQTSLGLPRSY